MFGPTPANPSRRRINYRTTGPVYGALGTAAHVVDRTLTRQDWRDQHKVPATGGVLVVANHISNYDPLALGEFLICAGRWPRFLGKSELWRTPVVGFFARHCRQIPVERNTSHAVDSLEAARQALADGEMVVIYPEGTVGKDPDGWPMTARTGAARLALDTRCAVLPVGQWGANFILEGSRVHVPKFFPRKTLQMKAGDLLDLSDLYDHPDRHAAVRVASERMLEQITELVGELRDEPVPADRYDVRRRARVPKGPLTIGDAPQADEPVREGI